MITRLGTQVGTTEEMRLRSGHRVGVSGPAAKIPTTAAEARALLMKDVTKMPDAHAPAFREGLQGLMNRWTALQLAILNEWGGSESVSKGVAMYEELEHWFLKRKAGKYAEDLEELLIEILGDDFCVLCEDGSPREVANVACLMYEQVANGNYEMAADVCAKPLPKEHLELSKREEEDRRWTMGAERGAGGAGARMNDDSSDDDDDDDDPLSLLLFFFFLYPAWPMAPGYPPAGGGMTYTTSGTFGGGASSGEISMPASSRDAMPVGAV
mmetsp:Transcript_9777/g.36292  ORF Transcript_9777/g.36292 Transcript_9777/m.36292 type:complete len:269 (+) Transcript_9777:473-1279(+)